MNIRVQFALLLLSASFIVSVTCSPLDGAVDRQTADLDIGRSVAIFNAYKYSTAKYGLTIDPSDPIFWATYYVAKEWGGIEAAQAMWNPETLGGVEIDSLLISDSIGQLATHGISLWNLTKSGTERLEGPDHAVIIGTQRQWQRIVVPIVIYCVEKLIDYFLQDEKIDKPTIINIQDNEDTVIRIGDNVNTVVIQGGESAKRFFSDWIFDTTTSRIKGRSRFTSAAIRAEGSGSCEPTPSPSSTPPTSDTPTTSPSPTHSDEPDPFE